MIYGFQVMVACFGMGNYTVAIWVAVITGFMGAGLSYMLVDPFRPSKKKQVELPSP
jgi:flagellar motor component MotA